MKATILVLSLVFNLIALSVFGFLLHQKGGFTFVNEKITQVWGSTFNKTATTSPAAESVSDLTTIPLPPPETVELLGHLGIADAKGRQEGAIQRQQPPQGRSQPAVGQRF